MNEQCIEQIIEQIIELKEVLTMVLDQSWNGPLPDWCRIKAANILEKYGDS